MDNVNSISLGPVGPFLSAWHHRQLIARLTRREIEARYRGSLLGLLWSLLVPVILLLVYAFVFTVVFKTKWAVPVQGDNSFVLILFCGLILFNVFAECLNRAPSLMLAHASYIKKVVFPLEVLPWVTVSVALFHALVSAAVLGVAYLAMIGVPPATASFLPIVVLPMLLLALGMTLFFSSVGVFLRDLQQIMGLLTMLLMFLSPLFYPLSALPERFQRIVQWSPLTVAIEESRRVLFMGEAPPFLTLGLFFLASWVVVWLGFVWFIKTKKGFADVL